MSVERSISKPVLCSASRWLRILEQSDTRYLLLDPDEDHVLVQLLESRPEWTLNFWDQPGLLFVRGSVSRDALQPQSAAYGLL